jgi:hypothetical protein
VGGFLALLDIKPVTVAPIPVALMLTPFVVVVVGPFPAIGMNVKLMEDEIERIASHCVANATDDRRQKRPIGMEAS